MIKDFYFLGRVILSRMVDVEMASFKILKYQLTHGD